MTHPGPWVVAAVLAGSYLLGSIPVAWLLGRWRHLELRDVGSGNPGTSNLFRNAGAGVAVLSGPTQFAQGVAAVLAARAIGGDAILTDAAAVFVVVGNGWPVWLHFNGQRCIAVATGAAAALQPLLLIVLLAWFAAGGLAGAIALGVLGGFVALPVAAAWIGGRALALTCVAMLVAIVLRRLEGVGADLRVEGGTSRRGIVLERVLRDRRPGQVLVGPRRGALEDRHPV